MPIHHWILIPLGRMCAHCKLVQTTGEFDDATPCKR